MKKSISGMLLLGAAISLAGVFASSRADAVVLTPGLTAPPTAFASIPGTLLGSVSGTFSTPTINGTFSDQVIRDTATGTLDFLIQVTNGLNSQAIEKITNGVFDSFLTDVGFVTPGGTAGTLTSPLTGVAPSTVDRSLSQVIGFNFPGLSALLAGQETDILVIKTNATNFGSGNIGIIDSTTATLNGFIPVAATPIPGALPLMGSALGAGYLLMRRRRQRGGLSNAPVTA